MTTVPPRVHHPASACSNVGSTREHARARFVCCVDNQMREFTAWSVDTVAEQVHSETTAAQVFASTRARAQHECVNCDRAGAGGVCMWLARWRSCHTSYRRRRHRQFAPLKLCLSRRMSFALLCFATTTTTATTSRPRVPPGMPKFACVSVCIPKRPFIWASCAEYVISVCE